ncbi:hypothetical protein B0H14DRAFT_3528131 [Mycena olivaceomarginata]|nr:hypothetical protein B0H14DRAFT_3528131 [Mycena olivaceomarginata]
MRPLSPVSPGGFPKSPKTPRSPGFSRLLSHARSLTNLGSKRNRRTGTSGTAYELPPELWLKVFMNIPLFLLPAVTLTCRSFHSLAQPLLFTTISTHPAISPSSLRKDPRSLKYRQRVSERVEFFFSPEIYPSIVECRLSPPSPEEDGPTDDLIDTIFDCLAHLPNLKILACRFVRLTPRRLAVLQRLQLTTLSLELCFGEIADFACAPSVPLQEVTFKYPDTSLSRDKANPCLPFLSPNHLEQLHATTTSVLPSLAHSPPFRKLRTLDIPVECITSDLFIPALARCPAVDHLSLHVDSKPYPRSSLEGLPEGVLPLLTSYRGPHHLAAVFLRGRNAQKVDISIPCHPQKLEASLKGVAPSLTSLSFRLQGVELPGSLLGAIQRSFPALKSLAVTEPSLSSADIMSALRSIPPTLHRRDKFNLWIPPDEAAADAISCFKKTLPALLVTFPTLKAVRFMHGAEGARVMWRRSSFSGMFVQVAA